jgi:ActR/RegA family two-component response regulator
MIAHSQTPLTFRPRLVLGYASSAPAALISRHFRRLGWEVHLAGTSAEVHRLVGALAPEVVVLDVDLRDESGWLTCVKLRLLHPEQKVILLADQVNNSTAEFADFVGAVGLVDRADGLPALVSALVDAALHDSVNLPVEAGK